MDPYLFTLTEDLTAAEALERLRATPQHAHYHLFVTTRDNVLVGVLNLRQLMLARPKDRVGIIMGPATHRIPARLDRDAILKHPGWHVVHTLPVVDHKGLLLGSIRYGTLKRLEREFHAIEPPELRPTVEALGGLFSVGVASMIDGLAAAVTPQSIPSGKSPSRED